MKRVGHLPAAAGSWRAVFSSGGLLPAAAAADATRVLGACPVEVLGSTETSGVAWRCQQRVDGAVNFAAMPKVEVRHGAEDLLEVRSPFSGQTQWLSMGDRVRFVGANEFELLGRGDHLAKIEDKRVSLAEIERCLLETGWVQDAAAVALDGRTRQFVGVVLQLGSAGAAELKRRGRRAFNEALKTALRSRIEAVALAPEVPLCRRDSRQRARQALAGEPQRAVQNAMTVLDPIITAEVIEPPAASIDLLVPSNLAYFRGHFPDLPIVPGWCK